MSRTSSYEKTLGQGYEKLQNSKVLMVGAGGIGCELLKNLVLTGISEIHIVDLDTIDLSNLNRQFLFGHEHIKKSKALVAKEVASEFNPHVKIVAYFDNIKDDKFDVAWFKKFDIVFNALDNLDARRHVNHFCVVAGVPLIESGTSGFQGQVQPVIPGETECYDCTPKPTPKTFAVCTIRSTPSQPIHCVVWAKSYLFSQLFDAEAQEVDETAGEDQDEIEKLKKEENELKELKTHILEEGFIDKIFNRVFFTDINRLVSMESMWKTRKPPSPLKLEDVSLPEDETFKANDQAIWSLEQNVAVLLSSFKALRKRLRSLRKHNGKSGISFDKDDDETLQFVVAAANIRSIIFHIETKSKFDVKEMAGNIIPAIATTNAVIAGICVIQAANLLLGKKSEAKMVFISSQNDRVFNTETLRPPNPECVVSGVARATLSIAPKTTLGELIEVLQSSLDYSEELSILTDKLIYDPDFDDNTQRLLQDLSIVPGSFVTVVDEDDDPRVNLEIYVESGDHESIVLTNTPKEFPKKPKATCENGTKRPASPETTTNKRQKTNGEEETIDVLDDIIEMDDDDFVEID